MAAKQVAEVGMLSKKRKNKKKHQVGEFSSNHNVSDQIRQWSLRILLELQGYKKLGNFGDICEEDLANILEIPLEADALTRPRMRHTLRLAHRKAEKKSPGSTFPILRDNLKKFGKMMGLSGTEQSILEFLVILHQNPLLESYSNTLDDLSTLRFQHALAVILKIPVNDVKLATSTQSMLEKQPPAATLRR